MVNLKNAFDRFVSSLFSKFNRVAVSRLRLLTISLTTLIVSWSTYSYLRGYLDVTRQTKIPRLIEDYNKLLTWPKDLIETTSPQERLIGQLRDNDALEAYPVNLIGLEHMRAEDVWSTSKTDEVNCLADVDWIQQKLHDNPYYYNMRGQLGLELTNYLEAFGHVRSDYHRGWETTWFDRSEYCELATLDGGRIKNKLCMGQFKSVIDNAKNSTSPRIRIGLCLPESCQSRKVNYKFREKFSTFAKQNIVPRYSNDLQIEKIVCLPDESSQARQIPIIGWLLIAILSLWFLLVLIASIWDCYRTEAIGEADETEHIQLNSRGRDGIIETISDLEEAQTSLNKYRPLHHIVIDAFSLVRSMQKFLLYNYHKENPERESRFVDLCWLDFVKIFMAFTVLTYNALRQVPNLTNSGDGLLHFYMNDWYYLSWNVNYFISTFFLIFALLLSFKLTKLVAVEKRIKLEELAGWRIWSRTQLNCLQRVWPLFLLAYLFKRLVFPYIGEGFHWAYGLDDGVTEAGKCQNDYWLKLIPYLANEMPCNEPAWFVQRYLIYALIIPPIVYVLNGLAGKWRKLSFVCLLTLLSVGNLIHRFIWAPTELIESESSRSLMLLDGVSTTLMDQTSLLTHLNAIAVGSLTGYLLCSYKSKNFGIPRWIKHPAAISVAIILNLVILMVPVISRQFYLHRGALRSRLMLILQTLMTFGFWPILNGLAIFLLSTQCAKCVLRQFMGHQLWHCVNKLTFCMYIIQYPILIVISGYVEAELVEATNCGIVMLLLFVYTVTVFSALFLHLLFETPLNALLNLICARLSRK